MNLAAKIILEELNLAFRGMPSIYYPKAKPRDIQYNFFLDMESTNFQGASSRIHLFGEEARWAIVFEKSGYHSQMQQGAIQLIYIGNSVDYLKEDFDGISYISNAAFMEVVAPDDLAAVECRSGNEPEIHERIDPEAERLMVRGKWVPIEHDPRKYRAKGIELHKHFNPRSLIPFADFMRYVHATQPTLLQATEFEIKHRLAMPLPKLLTIDHFNHISLHDRARMPSTHETYKLISEVLVTLDPTLWQPTLPPNNDWSYWQTGN